MSKKHLEQQAQEGQFEGGDTPAGTEHVEGGDTSVEQSTEPQEQSTETPEQGTETTALGIGQFVRLLLKAGKKTNAEILELVLATYDGSKTTAACIAWYKTDMRKKGLLDGHNSRGKNKTVEFTAEQLEALKA